jgi:hypothetical protein
MINRREEKKQENFQQIIAKYTLLSGNLLTGML